MMPWSRSSPRPRWSPIESEFESEVESKVESEVESEVEEGLVELEVPLEHEEVVLGWEGAVHPRPLCAIANRARHGSKVTC